MADFRLRIGFAKQDAATWLSHLELVRAMERCIRRSGIPYAVSQGFSPHIKHSFSAALPVGTGSLCEYLDVDIEYLVDPEEALRALQHVEHPALPVKSVSYAPKGAPSLQVDLNLASYRLCFARTDEAVVKELAKRLETTPSINVAKKNKMKAYELALYVASFSLVNATELELSLISRPEGSLRPEVILGALAAPDLSFTLLSLTRTKLQHKDL